MKQYAKRWLASILAVMMVITIMPNYAFAIDDNDTSAGSTPTCVCETKCTDTQVNENCPVCGAEGADLSTCKGTEIILAPECNCTTKCADGTVKADCPVCGAEGADLSACKGAETIPEPECTCETKCTEGSINQNCAVCSAENADLTQCKGKEVVPELTCTCETQCTEDTQNDGCEKCAADWTQCQGIALTAPNPLSGDGLPTKDATCSYVSNENGKTGAEATLAKAIDVLNKNGGGTITVTSSGLVDNSIRVSTPIVLVAGNQDVKIVMEPPAKTEWHVDVYSMFLLAEGGAITFGKSDSESEDPVLTISGNNWTVEREHTSGIVLPDPDNPAQGTTENPNVILYDGVVLEDCSDAVLCAPVVEMHGGVIHNTGTKSGRAIHATRYALMDGGIIENIYSTPVVAYSPQDSQDPEDGTVVLTGTAIIRDCAGASGAAWANNIQMSGHAKISNCTGSDEGALMASECVELSGNAQILNCTGHNFSGGITADTVKLSGHSLIYGCQVTLDGPYEPISGGGVYSYYHFSMNDFATIENCVGYTGGGVFLSDNFNRQDRISGNAKIINNRAVKVQNTDTGDGGGVFLAGGSLTISENAQITGNHADSGRGGGIFVGTVDTYYDDSEYSGIVTLQDNAIIANNSAETGAGVYLSGMLEGKVVSKDRAPAGQLTMNGGSITGNIATENGGGVYVDASIDPVGQSWPPEKKLEQATLIINSGSIKNNEAVNGAGVYVVGYWNKISGTSITKPGVLYLNGGSITGNIATENGGGVYIYGHRTSVSDEAELFELKMTGGMIQKNIADKNGGGIFTDGSDKYSTYYSPRLLFSGGSIDQNKAGETGGGLYLHYLSDAMLSGAITVDHNEAAIAPNAFLDWNGAEQSAVPSLSDLQAAYTQGKDAFKTFLMEEYYLSYGIRSALELVSEQYDLIPPELLAQTIDRVPALKEALGQYVVDGKYTGTKEQFLAAYEDYLKESMAAETEKMYLNVVSGSLTLEEIYDQLWGSLPQYKIASFTVTDSHAAGSQIGIITEDPHNGRVVAKGDNLYTVTDEDLAAFFSDDATYKIVRLSEHNQLVLERSYIITATAGANGRISPQGKVSAAYGEDKTFTITPDEGYYISDVKIDGISQGAINSYTFEDICADHTIEVIFAKNDVGGGGGGASHPEYTPDDDENNDRDDEDDTEEFTDEEVPLAETPWLNTEDHYAYIVGYSEDGTVRPNANITRAEVATIFFRLLTDDARDQFWSTSNNFSDVAPDAWYNNAVSTMVNAGIIQGYEDGTFRPNASITRAEFAAIASRFMSAGYDVEEDLFTDIAAHWARESINDAAMAKWISGYPDGTFLPDKAITRAEAVTLVNNVLQRKPDADHMLDSMIKWSDNMDTSAWYYEAIQEATNSHDYDLFEGAEYETWTALQENRDWAALEKDWVNAHRTGGEVM